MTAKAKTTQLTGPLSGLDITSSELTRDIVEIVLNEVLEVQMTETHHLAVDQGRDVLLGQVQRHGAEPDEPVRARGQGLVQLHPGGAVAVDAAPTACQGMVEDSHLATQ